MTDDTSDDVTGTDTDSDVETVDVAQASAPRRTGLLIGLGSLALVLVAGIAVVSTLAATGTFTTGTVAAPAASASTASPSATAATPGASGAASPAATAASPAATAGGSTSGGSTTGGSTSGGSNSSGSTAGGTSGTQGGAASGVSPWIPPSLDECGGRVPLITTSQDVALTGEQQWFCVRFDSDIAAFMGVRTPNGGLTATPDLAIDIETFNSDGSIKSRKVRVDDMVGVDPHVYFSSFPGATVRVGIASVYTEALDGSEFYVDFETQYDRTGPPSGHFFGVSDSHCSQPGVPNIALGDSFVDSGFGDNWVCVSVPSRSVVSISANSALGNDLELEMVGFDFNGGAIRYALNDDAWFAFPEGTTKPHIVWEVPAGTYVVYVHDRNTGTYADNYSLITGTW